MIPEIRERINAEFTDERFRAFLHELNTTYRYPTDFRSAETPIFLSRDLAGQLVSGAEGIVAQLQTPEFTRHASTAIPDGCSVPNEAPHPVFLQVDFGICRDDNGSFVPQLIELQGFPSLYGFQAFLNDTTRKHYSIPPTFAAAFNGYDRESYTELLRQVIVGTEDPAHVILLEIEPEKQKTRIDFAVTEAMLGIRTVCLTKVKKRGRSLIYDRDGVETPIRRIYNRVIFDELQRKGITAAFSFTEELDVHWVGHPNWYFRISKHTLPFLKSRYVPECRLVSELKQYPDDLSRYVLKPLYSFAGLGVDIDVTKEKLDALTDRSQFLLQRKVEYADLIRTPDGYAKAEVRMMYIWPETPGARPILVKNLVRLSKGRMMGVDFNKNKTWVGSSIAYHEPVWS
ncbi:MAG: hypothetical protein HUU02_08445 [Bacteroidetes bacterium]|nr:hypothetical protein [Bacteroidota bacterium]